MSFQPVVPFSGVGGWNFLSRTREAQQDAFDRSPVITRDTDYFEAKIGDVKTAEDLVSDRRLLRVALGAFGLDADLDSRFFIKKVLGDGTIDPKALSNRLSDKRYQAMAKEFGFDLTPPKTSMSDFGTKITGLYRDRQFEIAVGQTQPDLRLAMALDRDLSSIAGKSLSEKGKWFTIMANPPLRSVFERVFSLPASTGALDLDRQLAIFQDKAEQAFGTSDPSVFTDPARVDELRVKFLARSDATGFSAGTSRGSAALALLQNIPRWQGGYFG